MLVLEDIQFGVEINPGGYFVDVQRCAGARVAAGN
jgi:hypothetical protein